MIEVLLEGGIGKKKGRRRRAREIVVAAARERRRRVWKEVADIVAVDGEGIPVNERVLGVDEGRHVVIVEQQRVPSHRL